MPADADGFRHNAIQDMFWTRTGLLLLVLVVVAVGSLTVSSVMPVGTGKNLVVALGTGTLISAVVGFGQTLITSTASQRALVDPVVEESTKALRDLAAEYRSMNSEFFPTDVFEPTAEPDPGFNHLLMRDLHAAKQYFFRGFSGRHAAARLLLSQSEWELRVVVADARDGNAIGGRARYLLRYEGADADAADIQQRLHEEISIGLVGLYLARSRCSKIEVTVIADPPLDRLELFDHSVWLTLFSDTAGATALYPRTLRFSDSSYVYGMERTEFLRVCNSRGANQFVITPDTSWEEFATLFHEITGNPLSENGFTHLEEKFRVFSSEFSALAGITE